MRVDVLVISTILLFFLSTATAGSSTSSTDSSEDEEDALALTRQDVEESDASTASTESTQSSESEQNDEANLPGLDAQTSDSDSDSTAESTGSVSDSSENEEEALALTRQDAEESDASTASTESIESTESSESEQDDEANFRGLDAQTSDSDSDSTESDDSNESNDPDSEPLEPDLLEEADRLMPLKADVQNAVTETPPTSPTASTAPTTTLLPKITLSTVPFSTSFRFQVMDMSTSPATSSEATKSSPDSVDTSGNGAASLLGMFRLILMEMTDFVKSVAKMGHRRPTSTYDEEYDKRMVAVSTTVKPNPMIHIQYNQIKKNGYGSDVKSQEKVTTTEDPSINYDYDHTMDYIEYAPTTTPESDLYLGAKPKPKRRKPDGLNFLRRMLNRHAMADKPGRAEQGEVRRRNYDIHLIQSSTSKSPFPESSIKPENLFENGSDQGSTIVPQTTSNT